MEGKARSRVKRKVALTQQMKDVITYRTQVIILDNNDGPCRGYGDQDSNLV